MAGGGGKETMQVRSVKSIDEALMVGSIIKGRPELGNQYVQVHRECQSRGLDISLSRVRIILQDLRGIRSRGGKRRKR
jgi:hypothetical protein